MERVPDGVDELTVVESLCPARISGMEINVHEKRAQRAQVVFYVGCAALRGPVQARAGYIGYLAVCDLIGCGGGEGNAREEGSGGNGELHDCKM